MGNVLVDFDPVLILLLTILQLVNSEYCPGLGAVCPPPQRCCHGGSMCCMPTEPKSREEVDLRGYSGDLQFGIWNLWYFWFVVIFLFMACTGACAFWRHRRRLLMAEQAALSTVSFGTLVQSRRSNCPPPSQLSSQPSRNSLSRFSYFSTVLASSPSTQEPQGAFPSPPPYSEIGMKSSEVPSNTVWTDLPPYPGVFGLDPLPNQLGGHVKDVGPSSESAPYHAVSNVPTSPPSYSMLSGAVSPPTYTVNSSRNRPIPSYPLLRSSLSVDSGEELLPENADRRPSSPS